MGLGSRSEPRSISVFFYSILLISGSSFSYPLVGEEADGKCRGVRLDECDRVRLGSSHPLWVRLPRLDASRRETNVASCLIAETTTQPTSRRRATLDFQAEQTVENFTACTGSVELEHPQRPSKLQLWHGSMNEGNSYVLFPWENYQELLSLFNHQPGVSTVEFNFSCQATPSLCLKLSLRGPTTHLYHTSPGYKAANVQLARRDAREAVHVSLPSSSAPKSSVYGYVLPVLLVAVAVLALMISAAVCVKGAQNEERVPASSTGKKESPTRSNQQEMSVLSNGLSSEAVTAPSAVENGPRTADSPSGANAEEVRISMGFPDSPTSPDEAEHENKRMSHRSTSSPLGSDEGRSRRSQEPLPQPPVLDAEDVAAPIKPEEGGKSKDEQDEEGEGDEPSYDYARVPGQEREEGGSESDEGSNHDGDEEGKKVPGKYGKVTRHSGVNLPTQETSYAEVKDLMDRRERSVTEPVDPCSIRDQMPLPRTFTESASASHLPLPAIPSFRPNVEQNVAEDDEDDMYDSVKDEVKEAAISGREKKQKLYEAVDPGDEDDNAMYESVPEELKEGVQQFQAPAVQPPPPKTTRLTVLPSNLPSPTKRLGSDSAAPPDSPGNVKRPGKKLTRDASKKEKGKGKNDDEDDGSKSKKQAKETGKKEKRRSKAEDEEDSSKSKNFSLFGRKKARSISSGIGKGKKDYKQVESPQPSSPISPEHHPPSIPPPALPLPFPGFQPEDDDDDDDGMYDSVTVTRTFSSDLSPTRQKAVDVAKAKSSSLPLTARSTGLAYNVRANEPLPEVPEDESSGTSGKGGAFVIKHKRVYEPGDPKYDIVGSTPKGVPVSKSNPELVEDDEFDPEYDTVNAPKSVEKDKQQDDQQQIGRQYAEVFKPPIAKASSIGHDDLGYAMVDPDIIMRKRAASMHESHSTSVAAVDSRQDKVERPAEPCPPQQNSDKIPVIILGSNDPGYDSVKNLSAQPNGLPLQGPDKVPLLILSSGSSGYNAVKGASAEEAITGSEDSRKLTPVPEDPGYESVNKLVGDGIPNPGYVNVMLEVQPSVEVTNNMYSQVDLIKKHEDRQRKLETVETGSLDVTSSSERLRTPSPAPPVPPVGDLGDLSEFEPPPIPRQDLSVSPLHVEHPYSKVIRKGDSVDVEDDALGYAAVDIVHPNESASKGNENSYDFAPGYEAVTDVVPAEKRQESSHTTSSEALLPLDKDGLVLQTAKSLQHPHQSSVSNHLTLHQTPADVSGPCSQPAPLENSDRTGDHLYEEVDRDDGDR